MRRRTLRFSFPGHHCETARFAKLSGLKNGRLLDAAEAAGLDVLITVDQHIPDQQDLRKRKLSILILCAPTNRLHDLLDLVPASIVALASIARGDTVRIRRSGA